MAEMEKSTAERREGNKGTKWIKGRRKEGDCDNRTDKSKKFIVIKYFKKEMFY
jgi:hypothetical protein